MKMLFGNVSKTKKHRRNMSTVKLFVQKVYYLKEQRLKAMTCRYLNQKVHKW